MGPTSTGSPLLPAGSPSLDWHDVDAFVRTIAAQTSLHFDHEPRQTDVWFMVDSNRVPPDTRPGVAVD